MSLNLNVFFWLVFILSFQHSFTQDLYMSRDIAEAYKKGCRTLEGIPGANYWQNYANYKINVNFDPKEAEIEGRMNVLYHNNSPDNIDYLVLRLYQNHFKKGNARNRSIHPDDVTDGVKISYIHSQTDSVSLVNYSTTNMYVYLQGEVVSGDSVHLEIHWKFKLPAHENQRFGKYNGAWFVGLWYPQVAVYDDIQGWDTFEFDWEQEFYNDFNNYEVEITAPRNYLVLATGEFMNPEKNLHEEIFLKYQHALQSDSVIRILGRKELARGRVTVKKKNLIWKFRATNVPDFAFCISEKYWWDARKVSISNENVKKDVFISSLYHPISKDFSEVPDLAASSIDYFSNDLPGIIFPYDRMTIFNGAKGGMEFPMMVNNASSAKRFFTVLLVSHEIVHTYFPFYLGTNERKYSWMDEGWAEYLPVVWQEESHAKYHYLDEIISTYLAYAGKEEEVVPMVPSIFYGQNAVLGYRVMSYYRAGVAYYVLHDMLGNDLFKVTLKKFIQTWNGKHPLPYDFFFFFNKQTGEDLNWFWNAWFFQPGYPDLALKNVEKKDQILRCTVVKEGALPVPLKIKIIYEDDTVDLLEYNASVWKANDTFVLNKTVDREVKLVTITHNKVPDVNIQNDTYHFKQQ